MIKPKQTYVDRHGAYYLVCDPIIDGLHEYFIVNLTECVCIRMSKTKAEGFLKDMDQIDLYVKPNLVNQS